MTAVGLGLGGALSPLGLPGSLTYTFDFGAAVYDSVGTALTDVVTKGRLVTASDALGVTMIPVAVKGVNAPASDTIGATDVPTAAWGMVVAQQLGLLESSVAQTTYGVVLADTAATAERVLAGQPVTISQVIGLEAVLQVQVAVTVLQGLGLADTFADTTRYGLTLSQTLSLADSLRNFFGGDLAETVGMSSVLLGSAQMPGTLSETVGLSQAETPSLIIRVTAADSVTIDDAQVLSMLFAPAVAEGIEISAAYLSPGESFTTWAMNTRTGAVTEYSNFVFNSFGKIGNVYLGASDDGLFALSGDNDAGDDIVARIKSGFAQFAGSKFTLLKGIYLGVRGEGDFVLRVTTGDNKTYDYAVSTRDQRTTKVNVGKGLRARYFAFELISAGQDFDLDTIEFVPIGAQRRV